MSNTFQILEKTLDRIRDRFDEFSYSFYHNLFRSHPELKLLFMHVNLAEQKKMLLGIIVLVVKNWHKPQLWATTLKKLGSRHVQYGAAAQYYPSFGEIFLITLEEYLGSDWTAEVKQAWIEAFEKITNLMLEGAKEAKEIKQVIKV